MEIVVHSKKGKLQAFDATDQHEAFELLEAEDANGNRFKIFSEKPRFEREHVTKGEQE